MIRIPPRPDGVDDQAFAKSPVGTWLEPKLGHQRSSFDASFFAFFTVGGGVIAPAADGIPNLPGLRAHQSGAGGVILTRTSGQFPCRTSRPGLVLFARQPRHVDAGRIAFRTLGSLAVSQMGANTERDAPPTNLA